MTRKEQLIELRNKVQSGSCPIRCLNNAGFGKSNIQKAILIRNAFNGSLDAALALHNALLPGWVYNIAPGFCHVIPRYDNGDQDAKTGINDSPARAWLIAIFNALIEQEP